jgi:hypothetical protein
MAWDGPETFTTQYFDDEGQAHYVEEPELKERNGLTFSMDQKMWAQVLQRDLERVNSEAMFQYLDSVDALYDEELCNDIESRMDKIP